MTQALYEAEPQFRAEVDRCLTLLEPMMGGEITREDVLANGESVHHTAVTKWRCLCMNMRWRSGIASSVLSRR